MESATTEMTDKIMDRAALIANLQQRTQFPFSCRHFPVFSFRLALALAAIPGWVAPCAAHPKAQVAVTRHNYGDRFTGELPPGEKENNALMLTYELTLAREK